MCVLYRYIGKVVTGTIKKNFGGKTGNGNREKKIFSFFPAGNSNLANGTLRNRKYFCDNGIIGLDGSFEEEWGVTYPQ